MRAAAMTSQRKGLEQTPYVMITQRLTCNVDLEEQLLSCLVDPINLSFDEVVLDQVLLAGIKPLVKLSKLRPEAGSELLVSHITTTGALLYGPQGSGKTLLARAIPKSTGSNMLAINPAVIRNKWLGESETPVQATFSLAREAFPCIVFIGEVDVFFYRRGDDDYPWQRSILTQFLHEMDGLTHDENASLVSAATNSRPMDLTSAFLRRLPKKIP
ncbi:Uu.00g127800.m01.CDS01 [Anthostomella pinea]|uniref:Uu.00g127800.m01.CDS01 n=1 Tax=Anthostomella pinea TaxID=933095 RepID=A0AAI8YHY0_9PEZI|nr:Uu.00g127800.m01.CDS01 [Anthostomella pinea]